MQKRRERLISDKQNLIAVLSHDLGNPIGLISNMANKESLQDFGEEEYFSLLKDASEMSLEIVETVRDMEAIRAGKKKKELREVQLNQIFSKLKLLFVNQLKEKSVSIDTSDIKQDYSVYADKSILLSNILSNIISNAIKFSHENGSIHVSINEEDKWTIITIKDKGIGMPKEILNNLFDINIPTNRCGTSNETGTGFGMPLVKSSIEFLGGKLEIQSKDTNSYPDEHGTTCIISLKRYIAK